jgi:hypothetical protein
LEECPHQSETNKEIAVGIARRGIIGIGASPGRVEMFGFYENSGLADAPVDEEIEIRIIAYFFLVLREELGYDGIIIVREVFCEIIEGDTGLQVERFFEKVVGKVQGVSGDKIGDIEDFVALIYFLIEERVVESEFPKLEFLFYFK